MNITDTSRSQTGSTTLGPSIAGPAAETCLCRRLLDERGQTTTEYALVLIAAASIAMLVVAWAGSTGAVSTFFDAVMARITEMLP